MLAVFPGGQTERPSSRTQPTWMPLLCRAPEDTPLCGRNDAFITPTSTAGSAAGSVRVEPSSQPGYGEDDGADGGVTQGGRDQHWRDVGE